MPRASRYYHTGHVWHITHRCHKQDFLLKFAKYRQCWLQWLFEAKKRYGLCVLDYIVTSNHIHLLVKDRGHAAAVDTETCLARCMVFLFSCSSMLHNLCFTPSKASEKRLK